MKCGVRIEYPPQKRVAGSPGPNDEERTIGLIPVKRIARERNEGLEIYREGVNPVKMLSSWEARLTVLTTDRAHTSHDPALKAGLLHAFVHLHPKDALPRGAARAVVPPRPAW